MKKQTIKQFHDRYVDFGVLLAIICKEYHITTIRLRQLTGLHNRHLSGLKKGTTPTWITSTASFVPSTTIFRHRWPRNCRTGPNEC